MPQGLLRAPRRAAFDRGAGVSPLPTVTWPAAATTG